MLIKMETSSGRILDETCNQNHEAYGDEFLYAALTDAPRVDEQMLGLAVSMHNAPPERYAPGFMANYCARKGRC